MIICRINILLSSILLATSDAFSTPRKTISSSSSSVSSSVSSLASSVSLRPWTALALASETEINIEGLVLRDQFDNDRASLLASAFEALNDDDKYDAVLTGLCSKILDGKLEVTPNQIGKEATLTPSQLALEKLKDPIRLVEEMNQRGVKASGRSLMALIDVSHISSSYGILLYALDIRQ
jgi:hypothetical protein